MTHLPYFNLYVGDEAADTAHLTAEEHGAYHRLRCAYWRHDGLPDDDERLIRITGVEPDRWPAVRDAIAPLFGPAWSLPQFDRHREESERLHSKKSKGGKEGARKRWGDRPADDNPNGSPTGSPNGIANSSPSGSPTRSVNGSPNSHQHQRKISAYEDVAPVRAPARDMDVSEYPFDPPETVEQGRRFLESKGVSPDQIEAKLAKLMAFRLYPSEVAA